MNCREEAPLSAVEEPINITEGPRTSPPPSPGGEDARREERHRPRRAR